jgi:hypothetical protein
MKNRLINLISLVPILFSEWILLGNYLHFGPKITPFVDQVKENSVVSGEVFAYLHYGYTIGMLLLAIFVVVLALLAWKEKTKQLLITLAVSSTIAIFIVGNVVAISNALFSNL